MKHWRYFVLVLITAGIFACNKDSDDSIPVTTSNISIFQAVPGTEFNVFIDTTTLTTGLAYAESSGYHAYEAKRYTLLVSPVGYPDSVFAGGQISLRNGFYYTLFLSLTNAGTPQVLLTEDDLRSTRSGYGRMRYINLSDTYLSRTSRLTVDVNVHTTTTDTGTDTVRYFRRLSYLAATDFGDVQVGPHSLFVTYADSTLSLNGTTGMPFDVQDQKQYTFIGYGNALKPDSFKIATLVN